MPLTKDARHGMRNEQRPPALSDALSALIAAADPNRPPSEDEILGLILDELVSNDGAGPKRRGD
jgi:hypothetical protein